MGCAGFGLIGTKTSGTLLTICGNGADSVLVTFTGSRLSTTVSADIEAFTATAGTAPTGVENV